MLSVFLLKTDLLLPSGPVVCRSSGKRSPSPSRSFHALVKVSALTVKLHECERRRAGLSFLFLQEGVESADRIIADAFHRPCSVQNDRYVRVVLLHCVFSLLVERLRISRA